MKYIILLILQFIAFSGCSAERGDSIVYCKEAGYHGIASYTNDSEAYCSNGEIHGNTMLTSSGEKELRYSVKGRDYNLVYIEFK